MFAANNHFVLRSIRVAYWLSHDGGRERNYDDCKLVPSEWLALKMLKWLIVIKVDQNQGEKKLNPDACRKCWFEPAATWKINILVVTCTNAFSFKNVCRQKECCSILENNEMLRTKHPPRGCHSHGWLQGLNCCMFNVLCFCPSDQRFCGRGLRQDSLTAGTSHHVMFFYGRVVVVVVTDRPCFSAVDIQLCAEGNGDFVYPLHKHTHLCFDASLRRHALVASDCLQVVVKNT